MIYLTAETPIMLAIHPVDFRKQIDGLVQLYQQNLQVEPRSGKLFVFINRSKTMIRILCYETNGYWLATKRLSKGRYLNWPKLTRETCELEAARLREILSNLLDLPDEKL